MWEAGDVFHETALCIHNSCGRRYVDFLEERVEEMRHQLTDVIANSLRNLPVNPDEEQEPSVPSPKSWNPEPTDSPPPLTPDRRAREPNAQPAEQLPSEPKPGSIPPNAQQSHPQTPRSVIGASRRLLVPEPSMRARSSLSASRRRSQSAAVIHSGCDSSLWGATMSPAKPFCSNKSAARLGFAGSQPREASPFRDPYTSRVGPSHTHSHTTQHVGALRAVETWRQSWGAPPTPSISEMVSDFEDWRGLALERAKMQEIAREWQAQGALLR